jgi:hypothetical protein
MCYKSIISDPVIMAVISALVGTVFAYSGTRIYDWRKGLKTRQGTLKHLKKLLETHKARIEKIGSGVTKDILGASFTVQNLYVISQSDSIDIEKDSQLLFLLSEHIENLELINRCHNLLDIRSGGFTSTQREAKENLESNLSKATPEIISNIDKCIEELSKKIN